MQRGRGVSGGMCSSPLDAGPTATLLCLETPTAAPTFATCSAACESVSKSCATTCFAGGTAIGGFAESGCQDVNLNIGTCDTVLSTIWYSGVNGTVSMGCCCE